MADRINERPPTMSRVPEQGEVYLHQNGLAYEVLCLAKDDDREEILVIHRGKDGAIWSRTIGNFMGLKNGFPRFIPNQETST